MADVWFFEPAVDSQTNYADGTIVPHRGWRVLLNDKVVGEIDAHMHRRLGPDGKVDMSFGFTSITYGPPPGGK